LISKVCRFGPYLLFRCLPLIWLAMHPARAGAAPDNIMSSPTFHQKVEGFSLSLTANEMEYLLDNLPCAAQLLTVYGIHPLTIERRGGHYHAEDENGLEGTFQLEGETGGFREYRGKGAIKNSSIGVITAHVVATIRYSPVHPFLLTNDLEFWVLVDNDFLDFLCRVFRPLLKSVLRNNVEFLVETSQKLANTIRERGGPAACDDRDALQR
jgi:hypothetical protein